MLAEIRNSRSKLFHRWCEVKAAMTDKLTKARHHISHSGFIFIHDLMILSAAQTSVNFQLLAIVGGEK
jgi:hypothetical protein